MVTSIDDGSLPARLARAAACLAFAVAACSSDGEGTGGTGGSGGGSGGMNDGAVADQPPGDGPTGSDVPAGDGPPVDAPAGEPIPDKPAVKKECVAYCSCAKGVCGKITGYPWKDEAACWVACETYDEKKLSCWQMWCDKASTAPAKDKAHLCEHVWGKFGLDECPK